jgi:hypothetical protein
VVDDLFEMTDDGAAVLHVHAQPGAGRTAVAGRHGDALKVRVAAPPEGGRANEALVKCLAELFGVKAAAVELAVGDTSRTKRFRIVGVDADDFRRRLQVAVDASAPDKPAAPRRVRRP